MTRSGQRRTDLDRCGESDGAPGDSPGVLIEHRRQRTYRFTGVPNRDVELSVVDLQTDEWG